MKDHRQNVLIVVRSKRSTVQTLNSYRVPSGMRCIVLSDPSVFSQHKKHFRGSPYVEVVKGVEGLAAQAHRVYRLGYDEKFDWVFRLDDDLHDKYFLTPHPDTRVAYPKLDECIRLAYRAAVGLSVGLVGFASTSRLDWMGKYLALTYGGLHGSAQLHCTARRPSQYIDPLLPRFEDIWRSCSHRHHDGAIGRVQMIGIQQAKSSNAVVNQSVVDDRASRRRKAIAMVNRAWPDYVSCTTDTAIHAGKVVIPHFAFTRHGYSPRHIEP